VVDDLLVDYFTFNIFTHIIKLSYIFDFISS
jgi:hypothetical protein